MRILKKHIVVIFISLILLACGNNQNPKIDKTDNSITVEDGKPWVYWFLTDASITKKGITTDLEAMKENGIGGALMFTVRGPADPPFTEPPVVQLTPEWWDMMKFMVNEAHRLGLKLGIHPCDGFTAAGGPWITPELSMQKVVWKDTIVEGNQHFKDVLPQPEKIEGYYEDIAVYAYPAYEGVGNSTYNIIPKVSTNVKGKDASFLVVKGNERRFTSDDPCWIQYSFNEPFLCRSITLQSGWNNYQANRMFIETSTDGKTFKKHGRLDDYRHGWDDRGATVTHLIEPVSSKYFRFVFDPSGTEPGAEDLDDAKWSPELKVSGIELSGDAKIHHFEGKSAAAWRVSKHSNDHCLPESVCVDPDKLVNISSFLDKDGQLEWEVPDGKWVILRMGHTSTGLTNYIGGGGMGLECDKLNPEAVELQFRNWFEAFYDNAGKEISKNVITELYNDSWECGSQNWSPIFLEEFAKRRGYDLLAYLPVMAGVPIKNADLSDRVLYDIRETVAELLVDNYHGTMNKLAHEKGCRYSTECVAPVFVSDGMLHYRESAAPTGEFWFRSPSHDKPNDILDAVSAAHIYGKKLVRAESGTELRLDWDEHPGMLKTLFDRNFAIGINKVIFHVFAHDPWTDRKPGKTVGVVGIFFQPNQTWWKPGKAWVAYINNCHNQLQQGVPVVDIAVFTGEEIPRRAILPDRLVPVLPGIFGNEKVESEKIRLENTGQPTRQKPRGVTTLKNLADPVDWIDPLNGYKYDSFNPDALLRLAEVQDGRIVLPGGASYKLLIIPGTMKMNPNKGLMSVEVAQKLLDLAEAGATIMMLDKPFKTPGFENSPETDNTLKSIIDQLYDGKKEKYSDAEGSFIYWKKGKGRIIQGPYLSNSFVGAGIDKDFTATNKNRQPAKDVAWNHRKADDKDIYFVSNQLGEKRELSLSFRTSGKSPHFYFPISGDTIACNEWEEQDGRIVIPFRFEANESVFVIFGDDKVVSQPKHQNNWSEFSLVHEINANWEVKFKEELGGPKETVIFEHLTDWGTNNNPEIKYYSGTAAYLTRFNMEKQDKEYWLELGEIANIAEVNLNGVECGTVWTAPFRLNISEALIAGENILEIAVTNTWANRLQGDHELPKEQQITWTNAPYRLEGKPLLKAGLIGPVQILNTNN